MDGRLRAFDWYWIVHLSIFWKAGNAVFSVCASKFLGWMVSDDSVFANLASLCADNNADLIAAHSLQYSRLDTGEAYYDVSDKTVKTELAFHHFVYRCTWVHDSPCHPRRL